MRWVALMPLRAGSRSIAGKNLRPIAGRPLFAWSLGQAVESGCFDGIYVATDSDDIGRAVKNAFPEGVSVIDRTPETATDTASTESIMIEFQARVEFDVLCLVQATSPLTRAGDFRAAREKFEAENLDSLLTGVPSTRFLWSHGASPLNYEPARRPRRQDFDGHIVENGAFYFTRAGILSDQRCRLGGRIGIHLMDPETERELDEPADWAAVEELLRVREGHRVNPFSGKHVRALIVDVDGTLTDGGMYYDANGETMKKFDTRDAHGLLRVRDAGTRICVITGEVSPVVAARMRKLGLDDYHPGVKEKLPFLRELSGKWGIELQHMAYIGDDFGDLECMQAVGVPCCPADAVPEIRATARFIAKHRGGEGAVREICDLILAT